MEYLKHNKVNYLQSDSSSYTAYVFDGTNPNTLYTDYIKYTDNGIYSGINFTNEYIDVYYVTVTSEPTIIIDRGSLALCNNILYNFSLPFTCSNFIGIPTDTTITFTVTINNSYVIQHIFPVNQTFVNTYNLFNCVHVPNYLTKFTITAATNNNTELTFYDVTQLNSENRTIKFIAAL